VAIDPRTAQTEPVNERLSRSERREQLLDSAAALLQERGFDAVTMEGVAARAGVSKALPYNHFENAGALVEALYGRELGALSDRVVEAGMKAQGFEEQTAAVVHECFETIKDRPLLGTFARWFPQFETKVRDVPHTPPTPLEWFIAQLFEREGLSKAEATIAQRTVSLGIIAAFDTWSEGWAGQAETERLVTDLIVGGVRCIAASRG
jgi:AcrR family transcriptional regulator